MNRLVKLLSAVIAGAFALFAQGADVGTYSELVAALNGTEEVVSLTANVQLEGELTVARKVTLDLNGKTLTAASGSRLISNTGDLTITGEGLLTGGNVTGNGGAITSSGTLTIAGGTICGNSASGNGGAVYVSAGTFTFSGGVIGDKNATMAAGTYEISSSGNSAAGFGGGIAAAAGTTVNISGTAKVIGNESTNVTAANNAPYPGGGGLYMRGATLNISGGEISFNKADTAGGARLDNCTTTVTGGTIASNRSLGTDVNHGCCGGFLINGGVCNVSDVVVSNNISQRFGGGIHYFQASGTVSGGTFTGNKALTGKGGGVYNERSSVTVTGGDFSGNTEGITGEEVASDVNNSSQNTSANKVVISGGSFEQKIPKTYVDPTCDLDESGNVVNKTFAARIGTTGYETLAAAVAAAADGDTVTLWKSSTGAGIVIDKSITIDLANFTYTADDPAVGSTGTKNQAFQILKDHAVTFKNGTLTTTAGEHKTNFRFVIQNYANLTLDHVTVDGSNLAFEGKTRYTVSNNNGSSVFKNGTVIKAATENGYAFDVYAYGNTAYPSVAVTVDGATIDGNIEVDADPNATNVQGALTLTQATLNGSISYDGSAIVVKKGDDVTLDAPAGYKWDDNGRLVMASVAQIGETKYASLEDAFNAAQDTADSVTITLLMDVTSEGLVIPDNKFSQGITFDLNGHKVTFTSGAGSAGTPNQALQIRGGNAVTINNGVLEVADEVADSLRMVIHNYGDLTMTGVTVDGSKLGLTGVYNDRPRKDTYALCVDGKKTNGTSLVNCTLIGSTKSTVEGNALSCGLVGATVTVEGSTVTGDLAVDVGNVVLKGSTKVDGNVVKNMWLDDLSNMGTVSKEGQVDFNGSIPVGYKWNDSGVLVVKNVAKIGEVNYATIEAAAAALQDGQEMLLLTGENGDHGLADYPQAWTKQIALDAEDAVLTSDVVDVAYRFFAYNPDNGDLALARKMLAGEQLDENEEARIAAVEAELAPFIGDDWRNWHADFVISFNKAVAAESMTLCGNYGDYGTVNFGLPKNLAAGQKFRLLKDNGFSELYVSYLEILSSVVQFDCGAKNLSAANDGTEMTVELRLFKGTQGGNAEQENAGSIAIGSYTYAFGPAAIPQAYVTENTAAAADQGLDVAYDFSVADPDAEDAEAAIAAARAAAGVYLGWNADFVVKFDGAVEEGSVELAGYYAEFGGWVTFDLPALVAGQEYRLVSSALGENSDANLTYADLFDFVKTFTCGAKNLSPANNGKKMTVELRLFNPDAPSKFEVVTNLTYTFETPFVAEINGTGYLTLEEAYEEAAAGDTVKLLAPSTLANGLTTDKALTLDLNGQMVTVPMGKTLSTGANLTIVDTAETKGGVKIEGTVAVTTGKLDISALGYGTTGLVANQPGSLTISNGATAALPGAWADYTANQLRKNNPNFFAADTANGAKVTVGTSTYTWDADDSLWTVADEVARLKQGDKFVESYSSLADAFAAAVDGDTVVLTANATTTAMIETDKDVTLDLAGFTVKPVSVFTGDAIIAVKRGGSLTVDDSSANKLGALDASENANVYAGVKLTVKGESATGETAAVTVNNGSVIGYYYGISGNGGRQNTAVTVKGGTVKGSATDDCVGIFNPQEGSVTVAGGKVEGATGIYVKSGNIQITGGEIKAIGVKADYAYCGNGFQSTGDALVIDNCSYPGAPVIVSVAGGKFASENGEPIASYNAQGAAKITGFVSGGVFNKTLVDTTLCATGYSVFETGDADYPYTVASDFLELPVDFEDSAVAKISRTWIKQQDALKDLTDDAIRTKLLETAANGNPMWANYVLGISDSQQLLSTFAKDATSTQEAPKIIVTLVGVDPANMPTTTGLNVTYTLMTRKESESSWTSTGLTSTTPAISMPMPTSSAEVDLWLYQIKVTITAK